MEGKVAADSAGKTADGKFQYETPLTIYANKQLIQKTASDS